MIHRCLKTCLFAEQQAISTFISFLFLFLEHPTKEKHTTFHFLFSLFFCSHLNTQSVPWLWWPTTNVGIIDLEARRNYQMLCLLHEMEQLNETNKQRSVPSHLRSQSSIEIRTTEEFLHVLNREASVEFISFFAVYLSNGHGAKNIKENKWTIRKIITREISMWETTNPWNGFEGKLCHDATFETNRTESIWNTFWISQCKSPTWNWTCRVGPWTWSSRQTSISFSPKRIHDEDWNDPWIRLTMDKSRLFTFNFSSWRSKNQIIRLMRPSSAVQLWNEPSLRFWTLSAASLTVSFWRSTNSEQKSIIVQFQRKQRIVFTYVVCWPFQLHLSIVDISRYDRREAMLDLKCSQEDPSDASRWIATHPRRVKLLRSK